MKRIDKGGIAWGLLLSLWVKGLSDIFIFLLQGKFYEELTVALSMLIVSGILLLVFKRYYFPEEKG